MPGAAPEVPEDAERSPAAAAVIEIWRCQHRRHTRRGCEYEITEGRPDLGRIVRLKREVVEMRSD